MGLPTIVYEISNMSFYLGCALWSYQGWVGEFFPPGSRQKDFLRLYSQRLSAVEGNTTFYAVPNPKTIARWVSETPPGFKFCLKLPREITHNGLLQPKIEQAMQFIASIQGLGNCLAHCFAQLPPHYSPEFLDDLKAFLQVLSPENIALALEVRHPDWFREPHASKLNKLLAQLEIGRVLLDTRPIYQTGDRAAISQCKKPDLPLQPNVTAKFSHIRFISHPQLELNQPFLEEWGTLVKQWLQQGTQIYFFIHCPEEARSPHTARYLQTLLEKNGAPVPPLGWNQLGLPPQQLSLF